MLKILKGIEVGDIVRVKLDPTIGHEKRKERFCLVVENGISHLNLIIILPITADTGKRTRKLYVPVSDLKETGLSKPSVVDCYQIRTISIERLIKNKAGLYSVGKVTDGVLFDVRQRLALILDIGQEHINLT